MVFEVLESHAAAIRRDVLDICQRFSLPYITSSMGVVELLTTLYFSNLVPDASLLNYEHHAPEKNHGDKVFVAHPYIMPAMLATLIRKQYVSKDHVCEMLAELQLSNHEPLWHSELMMVPGIDNPFKPGLGILSYACGMAWRYKVYSKPYQVVCIVSDSQFQTPGMWELFSLAAHHRLDNLLLIVDHSRYQHYGLISSINSVESIYQKASGFGWKSLQAPDGHSINLLLDYFVRAARTTRKPAVCVCRTTLGKGIAFAENQSHYFGAQFTDRELAESRKVLS